MSALEGVALRIGVPPSFADAVANRLAELEVGSVLVEEEPRRTVLEIHVAAERETGIVSAITRYLDALAGLDPSAGRGHVERAAAPLVDWDAVFRAHHRALAIGRRLLVAPPWDVPDAPGREILVIEPGMAFGTGQHATTRTCLEEIEVIVAAGGVHAALDVGTGSGVLAAALARLRVARVVALDADPAVLPIARATLAGNGAGRVLLLGGTVRAVRPTFDLVVANLLADTLVAEAAALAAVVAPRGRLVVSGILAGQVERVVAAFDGWTVGGTRADDPWRTLTLVRREA